METPRGGIPKIFSLSGGNLKFKIGLLILLHVLFSSDQIPASDQDHPILIKGGTIHTVSHGSLVKTDLLFENGKITGIIDWENAHIGDPREEIGWVVHLSALSGIDILSAVKKDGGFLQYYSNLTGIEVTEEDVGFFRMFSCSSLATPILDAVRRRLSGESSLFTHLYLLQPLVMSNPVYAAVLGYPASSESP